MDHLLFPNSNSEDAHEVPQGGLLKPEAEINRFTVCSLNDTQTSTSCCRRLKAMLTWPLNSLFLQVDEHLSDIERVNLFLTGGQEVQQRKAIEG